ncbi:MAG: hypothetical protein QXY73_01880 [Candidatus Bathyarchaeia archaeon]
MKSFAEGEGIPIFCHLNGRFSFFNSPYYAHHTFTGVDIYPPSNVWFGSPALSPVDGEVINIKTVRCSADALQYSNVDYVIVLKCLRNPRVAVKLLHVDPYVNIGDIVMVGDRIGAYLRSGFFHYWTDPHIHLEVREVYDSLRARGGHIIRRTMPIPEDAELLQNLRGTVIASRPEYALIALESIASNGVTVDVNGDIGVLEGGIPHYGFFGVHLNEEVTLGSPVKLCGVNIGFIEAVSGNMGIGKYTGPIPRIKGRKVRLSMYFYINKPLLKLIPVDCKELSIAVGETVEITLA